MESEQLFEFETLNHIYDEEGYAFKPFYLPEERLSISEVERLFEIFPIESILLAIHKPNSVYQYINQSNFNQIERDMKCFQLINSYFDKTKEICIQPERDTTYLKVTVNSECEEKPYKNVSLKNLTINLYKAD